MAEISREKSIEVITKWIGCNEYDVEECISGICDDCKNNYEDDNFKDSVIKAISDMEKLEKIEQIFEIKGFGEYPCTYEDMAREVLKIIKG